MAATVKAAIASIPDMTEEHLGVIVGVSQGQISHWTGARLPIPASRAARVADALHISDPGSISVAYREIVGHRHSQSVRLDPAMVAQTHRALKRRFAKSGGYDIEKHPELFVEAYAIRVGIVGASVPQNVFDLVIEHANLTPQGASTDGYGRRGDGVPAVGGTGRKMGASPGRKA